MIVIIMIRDHHYIVIKIVIISILIILTITTQASARLAAELGFTRILTSGGAVTALQVKKDAVTSFFQFSFGSSSDVEKYL